MKMSQIKVRNMISPSGSSIANQFIIDTPDGKYFKSYDSVIVAVENSK